MINRLLNIKFIRNFFFTLRENEVYRTKSKIYYLFEDDTISFMYKGYMVTIKVPNFIEETNKYIFLGDGADYANLTHEERQNLLKYHEELEHFEKCQLIKEVENKLKIIK